MGYEYIIGHAITDKYFKDKDFLQRFVFDPRQRLQIQSVDVVGRYVAGLRHNGTSKLPFSFEGQL